MLVVLLAPHKTLIPVTVVTSLIFLAFLGGLAAKVGGASVKKGVIRVTFWSALSMAAAAGIGAMFGTVV
ncbi:Mlr6622 protein [Janthinobacterium sp. CG23_2]|nr:Mlr6622 protein [Janthinobacterium sp. CG23_2]CUU27996.1 Mlr6622 protein [Janthinobacterium sp. CG23_2]